MMKRFLKAISAIILMTATIIAVGCKPEDSPNNNGGNNGNNNSDVVVTTYTPQNITWTTADCGGDVIVTQGLSLNEIGVCWSNEAEPTVEDTHLSTTDWHNPFVCTLSGLRPGTIYYVRAYALRGLEYYYGEEKSFTTDNDPGHDFVDLGLPSGNLWATCNVGADNPEDFGNYFAWGEIVPKEIYTWSTYKWSKGNEGKQLTKYCVQSDLGYNGFTDNLFELQPEDDVATVSWGREWRIPSVYDWKELADYTTKEWITQNGVLGVLFTAHNGNTLFVPETGYYNETGWYQHYDFQHYIDCWTRTVYPNYSGVAHSSTLSGGATTTRERYYGLTIRPVKSD